MKKSPEIVVSRKRMYHTVDNLLWGSFGIESSLASDMAETITRAMFKEKYPLSPAYARDHREYIARLSGKPLVVQDA